MSSLTDIVKINQTKKLSVEQIQCSIIPPDVGAQWLSDRVLDSRPGVRASPASLRCVLEQEHPSLELVQPRKTRSFISERLLMGRKESEQTNSPPNILMCGSRGGGGIRTPPLKKHKLYGFL